MSKNLSRRDFIKIGSIAVGGIALAGAAKYVSGASESSNKGDIITKVPTYCEMCTFKCAGWVYLKNGEPWKIIGNEEDEHSYGRLCTKGSAGIGAYIDPDRLKNPLIRTEERGKQVFRNATWDEAFAYIAKKMSFIKDKYGPETVALFTHGAGGSFFKILLNAYGTDVVSAPSYGNCRGPREEAYILTFGESIDSPERTDIKNSKCIVMIGSHIGENTHSQQVNEFAQAIKKGADIIVADPRFSTAASKAKYWLPIKPATDLALILAWINVIIEEELYDKDYVKRYTTGFDELKNAVIKYTPEWAYPVTTIKPEVIRETAHVMAKNSPATLVHPGRFCVWYGDDTQRIRAGAILNALLGSWGRKGGFYNPVKSSLADFPHPKYPKPKRSWRDAMGGKYDLANLALSSGICAATVPTAATSLKFKGWFVYGTNLILSIPDKKMVLNAIQALDLLVAVDTMPSEITGYADVVLPECTYLERYDDVRTSQGRKSQLAVRIPAVKPKYDTKPAWWIARELGHKMGLGDYFQWKTIEEYLDYKLKKAGTSLEEMSRIGVKTLETDEPLYIKKGENYKFGTESGKIELYSTTLKQSGFDPVPRFVKHEEPTKDYYRLITGRSPFHSFGRTTNNPILTQLAPENEVWVNSSIAKSWGISTGQYVVLENQDGVASNKIKVRVTERIRPDCVYMVHGFGHNMKKMRKSYLKGADDSNLLTRVMYDPIMGGTGMRGNFVTFRV